MKRSLGQLSGVLVAGTIAALASTPASAGPVTPYWLTAGDQGRTYVVQGNSVIQTHTYSPGAHHEYPIAIADTVRTFGGVNTRFGREYNLDGTLTGTTYTNTGPFNGVWDGTTNASTANYSLTQGSHQVVRYDRDWTNPTVLFGTTGLSSQWGGITYDSSDDTIWLKARGSNAGLRQYALDGTLLGSFTVAGTTNWGLAYEEATDSFWSLGRQSGSWSIVNFDKTGAVLETTVIAGLTGNILGGEMQIGSQVEVHAPGAIFLFGAGVAFIGYRRRRRR